jgi:putative endonuclease
MRSSGVGGRAYRPDVDTRSLTGRSGESAAEAQYRRRGFRVVARNWRCGIGEIDLVLARGDLLVICEVKTRRSGQFGAGFDAVDARKRHKLRSVGEAFLQQHAIRPVSIRFDVVSVLLRPNGSVLVEVFEDAF